MLNKHVTSKAEIAKELNLSMPTVLANVNDLLEKMVLEETGEYASTGGRKAKSIGINKSYCHAMGILITANHKTPVTRKQHKMPRWYTHPDHIGFR